MVATYNFGSVYIISRDYMSSLNFSLRIILIRPHALSVMYFMCLCHVQPAYTAGHNCQLGAVYEKWNK